MKRLMKLTFPITLIAAVGALGSYLYAEDNHAETGATVNLARHSLTFSEEFNKLDVSEWGPGTRWIARTPWNGDFGAARFIDPRPRFPFTTKGGILKIEARKGSDGKWRSGLLSSVDRENKGFAQKYGYFEIRAKLPRGEGFWPSFWLVNKKSGRHSLEIDVFEHYGDVPTRFKTTVHVWDKEDAANNKSWYQLHTVPEGKLYDEFNTYGVNFDPEWIRFYFNRKEIWKHPTPPEFQDKMFVLLNLALQPETNNDRTPSPSHMEVDYVKVWAPNGVEPATN